MNVLQEERLSSVLESVPIHQGLRCVRDRETQFLWFVARDVCDKLGTNAKDIPAILDYEDYSSLFFLRGKTCIDGLNELAGLRKDTRMLSEPGLYRLVFRSRKPAAIMFQKWVCEDVLPSIRKYGYYTMPSEAQRTNPSHAAILELARRMVAEDEAKGIIFEHGDTL